MDRSSIVTLAPSTSLPGLPSSFPAEMKSFSWDDLSAEEKLECVDSKVDFSEFGMRHEWDSKGVLEDAWEGIGEYKGCGMRNQLLTISCNERNKREIYGTSTTTKNVKYLDFTEFAITLAADKDDPNLAQPHILVLYDESIKYRAGFANNLVRLFKDISHIQHWGCNIRIWPRSEIRSNGTPEKESHEPQMSNVPNMSQKLNASDIDHPDTRCGESLFCVTRFDFDAGSTFFPFATFGGLLDIASTVFYGVTARHAFDYQIGRLSKRADPRDTHVTMYRASYTALKQQRLFWNSGMDAYEVGKVVNPEFSIDDFSKFRNDTLLFTVSDFRNVKPNSFRIPTWNGHNFVVNPKPLLRNRPSDRTSEVFFHGAVSGPVMGRLVRPLRTLKMPWAEEHPAIEVRVMRARSARGDSGAWVICPFEKQIVGIVVASSPNLGLTYLMTASDFFRPIFRHQRILDPGADSTAAVERMFDIPDQFRKSETPMVTITDKSTSGTPTLNSISPPARPTLQATVRSESTQEIGSALKLAYPSPPSTDNTRSHSVYEADINSDVSAEVDQEITSRFLNDDERLFAKIGYAEYMECWDFLKLHPKAKLRSSNFKEAAKSAHERSAKDAMRRYIERAAMIEMMGESHDKMKSLAEKDSVATVELLKRCDTIHSSVR